MSRWARWIASLREDLLNELRGILHRTQIPAIYVTHDQDEAFTIADRVLLLHDGQIVREGTPAEVWSKPNSVWVAQFLGLGNIIDGKIVNGKWKIETKLGIFNVSADTRIRREKKSICWRVRLRRRMKRIKFAGASRM